MVAIVPIRICGYLIKHMCKEEEEMNLMKIKSNKVFIVQPHSQGSFLLVNPSIPTSSLALVVLGGL